MFEYELREEFEEKRKELKECINEIPAQKKLKFGCIVAWILIVAFFTLTNIGKQIVIVFGNICFISLLTVGIYRLYIDLKQGYNTIDSEETIEKSFFDNSVVEDDKGFSEYTVESVHNGVEASFDNEFEESYDNIKTHIVDNPDAPYYLLDTSTFFVIQEYTNKHKCPISDIVYGEITLNDSFDVLVNAIKARRCYVTQSIFQEIVKLEKEGRLEKGIVEFVEEDFGIWNNPDELPEAEKLVLSSDDKKYKEKHLRLVWDAMTLATARMADVHIISSNKKIFDLAKANMIEVVDPLEIKEEE